MGYKNRYIFCKRTYPETIILFYHNDKYKVYSIDKEILTYLKVKEVNTLKKLDRLKINYLVLNNMEIIKQQIFNENKYNLYYKRYKLTKLINSLKARIY